MFIDIVIFENKIMKVLYIYIYIYNKYSFILYSNIIMLEMRIRCNYMRPCIYISSVEYVQKTYYILNKYV
jgi:hypothetical protein